MKERMTRILYLVTGGLAVVLGVIGVILPVLPTTPFLIVAAWCFSRSSPRLHRWLLNQKLFGPLIRDWEEYGVIPLKAKYLSTIMIALMMIYPLFFKTFDLWMKGAALGLVLIGLAYIWTRPSQPRLAPSSGEMS